MFTKNEFNAVLEKIKPAIADAQTAEDAAQTAMSLIAQNLPAYNWVGIYWLEGEELVLGPYVGEPTDHTRIPVGRGVCGAAVAQNRNQVINDVSKLDNYLSCSLETRSEIVVLIRDENGRILGQIDADGHEIAAFDREDEAFLEQVAAMLAQKMKAESK